MSGVLKALSCVYLVGVSLGDQRPPGTPVLAVTVQPNLVIT